MIILRWLDKHFEEIFESFVIWFVVFLTFLQVVMRYVFKSSLSWPNELSRYCFIWFAYIALGYAVRYNCHTRIDIIETLIPKIKSVMSVICDLGFFVFACLMVKPCWNMVVQLKESGQNSPAMQFPMYLLYLSILVGMLLALLRLIQKYVIKIILHKKDFGLENANKEEEEWS